MVIEPATNASPLKLVVQMMSEGLVGMAVADKARVEAGRENAPDLFAYGFRNPIFLTVRHGAIKQGEQKTFDQFSRFGLRSGEAKYFRPLRIAVVAVFNHLHGGKVF